MPADVDLTGVRSSMFGAAYGLGNFDKVPQNGKAVRTLWEVSIERSVPAAVMHKKPKGLAVVQMHIAPWMRP